MTQFDYKSQQPEVQRGCEMAKILILDDNADDLAEIDKCVGAALEDIHRFVSANTETCLSLAEASLKLASGSWTAVVADLSLGNRANVSGYALLKQARKLKKPTIAVSDAKHVLKPGFIAHMYETLDADRFRFIEKTFLETELPRAFKYLLDRPRTEANLDAPARAAALALPDELDLNIFRVVKDYFRYDVTAREHLTLLCRRMMDALDESRVGHENYLLWAPPGSGKTFLIEQIMKHYGDAIETCTLDLANDELKAIRQLKSINSSVKPALCLIDEVDKKGPIPIARIFRSLDFNLAERSQSIVFVAIGSSGETLSDLVRTIEEIKPGGLDLLRRIPDDRRAELPPAVLNDKAIVFAARVRAAASRKQISIHRAALFYILQTEWLANPSKLDDLAKDSVRRAGAVNRIDYAHLFLPHDRTALEFASTHREALNSLWESDVTVLDGG